MMPCPVHNIRDCSPLLNGCNRVIAREVIGGVVDSSLESIFGRIDNRAQERGFSDDAVEQALNDAGYSDLADAWFNYVREGVE
jgi:hypothetical protein